ncbi:MAG: NAD(P)/FAD-dependent oxidoreductase [Sphaerochaetaceae bacterium]
MDAMRFDVAVIGGGPAGLAAAISARSGGASVVIIDRERALGGILKQCIHDGFGLHRFNKQLTGPAYAQRFIDEIEGSGIEVMLQAFVLELHADCHDFADADCNGDSGGLFTAMVSTRGGMVEIASRAVIVATGCRERTGRQVSIHGDRVSGVFNAGCIQNLVNLYGQLPGRRCAVLGSGDIGLIMARRLTLEGAEVIGVFEAKSTPSGLQRNIRQCLDDFGIPLHLGCTVTRTIGKRRLEAIEVADTDSAMRPVMETARIIECDSLIVSVGLIPEIELLRGLPVRIDERTHGPRIDQEGMASIPGLFCCGNASLVYDLVDYVSLSSEIAGKAAARMALSRAAPSHGALSPAALSRAAPSPAQANAGCLESSLIQSSRQFRSDRQGEESRPPAGTVIEIETEGRLLFVSPSFIRRSDSDIRFYFRSACKLESQMIEVRQGDRKLECRIYERLRPPQMETFTLSASGIDWTVPLTIILREATDED